MQPAYDVLLIQVHAKCLSFIGWPGFVMMLTGKGRHMTPREAILELQKRVEKTVLGQEAMIERLLIGLLANGNLLVEGLPGLAKTRAIKMLSKFLDAGLSRIQFTPDLLPSDITGSGG